MEDLLMALAAASGPALIAAAMTDTWASVRSGVARILGRTHPAGTAHELSLLDSTHAAITTSAGDPAVMQSQSELWTRLIREHLERDPGIATELRQALGLPDEGASTHMQNIFRGTVHGNVVQTQRIGDINITQSP